MSPCIHKTGHKFPYPSNCDQHNLNPIIQKNYKTTVDPTNKVVASTLDIVDMQEKIKDTEYIIKKIHVKPINVTKIVQRISDMETPTIFSKDDYKITKI